MSNIPQIIEAYDPDSALYTLCRRAGDPSLVSSEGSRNGVVTRFRAPVIIAWRPTPVRFGARLYRVSYSARRNANPFFHLIESMWMLAGRNDVSLPVSLNQQIATYSDDGVTLAGAYGHRWRAAFGRDQILEAIEELRKNPGSRRVVVSMYNPSTDGDARRHGGKDIPCNTHLYFLRDGDSLDMTVCNRSNDIVWGACGANVVHFSLLHDFVASQVGLGLGAYYQVTNNAHFYEDRYGAEWRRAYCDEYEDAQHITPAGAPFWAYREFPVDPLAHIERWCNEACIFLGCARAIAEDQTGDFRFALSSLLSEDSGLYAPGFSTVLCDTLANMTKAWACYMVWRAHKVQDPENTLLRAAVDLLRIDESDISPDWAKAGREWLQRRAKNKRRAARLQPAQRDLFAQGEER